MSDIMLDFSLYFSRSNLLETFIFLTIILFLKASRDLFAEEHLSETDLDNESSESMSSASMVQDKLLQTPDKDIILVRSHFLLFVIHFF